eukprot:833590-Rhodomonas_salina.2
MRPPYHPTRSLCRICIILHASYAMCGTGIGPSGCSTAVCPRVLRARYAVSGTEIGYAATRWAQGGISAYGPAMPSPDALPTRCPVHAMLSSFALPRQCEEESKEKGEGDRGLDTLWELLLGIVLCARYAISGTDVAYNPIVLRTCYAVSGTAISCRVALCACPVLAVLWCYVPELKQLGVMRCVVPEQLWYYDTVLEQRWY